MTTIATTDERQQSWTDERLVSECLAGNEEAWSALLDKYKNLIYSIPIKLGLYEDAADIFQSVCLDLLTELPRLRNPRALPKWLIETCYHKCLRHRRNAEKEISLDEDDHLRQAPGGTLSVPDSLLTQLETEQAIRNAVEALSGRCKQIFRMLFFEDPPRAYQAVAAELGIATGSIGFIRGRCLSRLKKQLADMGIK